MAALFRSRRSAAAAAPIALALAGALIGARAATRITTARGAITTDAKSMDVNTGTRQAVLRMVTISQGDLRVTADLAEASAPLDFSNSRWVFTGHVHITSADGTLQSDQATVSFRDNRIQSAIVTGHPAEFEQTASKTGVLAHGHADSIEYTVDTGTVRLTGNAWLKYGDSEITNPVLVYNIQAQKLEASNTSGQGERVHITVLPKKHSRSDAPQ